jgi:hypothetical protein
LQDKNWKKKKRTECIGLYSIRLLLRGA